MKHRYLLLSGMVFSFLFFNTGFTQLGQTNFTLPSVPSQQHQSFTPPSLTEKTESKVVIAPTLEPETEVTTEAETELSTEAIAEAETEAVSETLSETKVAAEASTEVVSETETATEVTTEKISYVPVPKIDEQLLTISEWSRPGKNIEEIQMLVIHSIGNPATTAQMNRDYYESLKDSQDAYMSANYIVGLDGEIIQCVPDDEMAICTKNSNLISLSIESCHPDETEKYNSATYISMVKLVAYLSEKYDLDREQIRRHYDVTGKECPRFFFENPDTWETFLDDVMLYRETCATKPKKAKKIKKLLTGLGNTYQATSEESEKATEKTTEAPSEPTYSDSDSYNNYDDYYYDDSYYNSNDYYYDNSYDYNYDYNYNDYNSWDSGYDTGYGSSWDNTWDNSWDSSWGTDYGNGYSDYGYESDGTVYEDPGTYWE